jgi:hypothetical protein
MTHGSALDVLRSLPYGREFALKYEELVAHLLESLLSADLDFPDIRLGGKYGFDRRDIIFENCSEIGFWPILRQRYRGEYLVFDAKNGARGPTKLDVLSLAHYLKPYGCGMFGCLVIRDQERRASYAARREQWISLEKMIITLNDFDLAEMAERKSQGFDVSYYIARKIAEFRMSL